MRSPAICVGNSRFELDQADSAVTAAYAALDTLAVEPPLCRNLIVYVHGRAMAGIPPFSVWDREPEKSRKAVIPELEARYGSAVLMLHWPHKGTSLSFPVEHARAAAPALGALLESVVRLSAMRAAEARSPLVLLTHSMGSIVLERLVMDGDVEHFGEFSAILISAPASQAEGSADWLGRLPGGKTFVTINRNDPVLKGGMLGNLGADALAGRTAKNVFYLDTSREDVGHRYFVFGETMDAGERRLYERFYRPVINGPRPDLNQFSCPLVGETIYRLT